MAVPIFTLQLNHKILPGRVTIGKYDGAHSCLTAATVADKVLIHSPHNQFRGGSGSSWTQANKEISLLSVNRNVTALCAGHLQAEKDHDVLAIGTPSTLLAYNVEDNTDIFYKEIADGVNTMVMGRLGSYEVPMVIIGGNCSVQGFDFKGNDLYWTVSGDNVRSLALLDFDLDGELELIVGSDDFDLRVYKDDVMIGEVTETEVATALSPLRANKMAYALANGTVGVYHKLHRMWRVKSKNRVVSVMSFDIDGDGVEELITGWSNGKIDARNSRTGEVVFKDNLSSGIAGIVEGDYRLDGRPQLLCCSVEGEVRGYDPSKLGVLADNSLHQEAVHDLLQRKQSLLLELRNYEGGSQSSVGTVIPAKTSLQTTVNVNMGDDTVKPHIELTLSTNNETVIRAVLVFAEGIFEGETLVVHPREEDLSGIVKVQLRPPRDVPLDIHVKVHRRAPVRQNIGNAHCLSVLQLPMLRMVGAPKQLLTIIVSEQVLVGMLRSEQWHVFEITRHLPRFSMYSVVPEIEASESFVSFFISERVQRMLLWFNQNFLLTSEMEPETIAGALTVCFTSLMDGSALKFFMDPAGRVVINTANMALAGDLVQSLASFLNLTTLQVTAEFPEEMAKVEANVQRINDLQDVRTRLAADLAHRAGIIRALVVRTEDSRLLADYSNMRQWLMQLQTANEDLIRRYNIRCGNHTELLTAVRELNMAFQKAARLRVGQKKADIVSLGKVALQSNNLHSLLKIMRTGEA